jgi:hypothetical protein
MIDEAYSLINLCYGYGSGRTAMEMGNRGVGRVARTGDRSATRALFTVQPPERQSGDGLPLGLQLVGRRGSDGRVLRAAAAVEAALALPRRRPPLEA